MALYPSWLGNNCLMRFLCLTVLCYTACAAAGPARFVEHTVATGLKGGYQVVAVDVNHDGKPDLIALASGMTELVWFENPSWERHVIAGNLSGMINLAAWDFDGDGIPEIVLASGFSMEAKKSAGIVSVLRHIGVISYSLYLWQNILTAEAGRFFPFNLAAILLCAELSYWYVERPSQRLRDRLWEKRGGDQPGKTQFASVGRTV